jgi:hypothetical protein
MAGRESTLSTQQAFPARWQGNDDALLVVRWPQVKNAKIVRNDFRRRRRSKLDLRSNAGVKRVGHRTPRAILWLVHVLR